MFDVDFARSGFPALETPWALLDNAGGSACARPVIDRVAEHLARRPVQLGASYPLSQEAAEAVAEGRRAAALLLGAEPDEVVFGASSTVLAARLAGALRPVWSEGDAVVVTDLDHESNVGPWRALEAGGIEVREWRLRTETATLELEDLEPLLDERTRLVAFTHCANVVGTLHDVPAITARIRAAGALSCVDGVAAAPHRRTDVKALGADFYFASLYKLFGPHLGVLYGRRELLREARGSNHFFVGADALPSKHEPGNPPYEQVAGVVGIVDYLTALDRHHGGAGPAEEALPRAFEHIARREAELAVPLLELLAAHPEVELVGSPDPDPATRVPTIAFHVRGRRSSELPPLLERDRVAVRFGHFYAYRAIERLGLLERDGVVRASLLHYNTDEEVERLVASLERALG